jgi:hypothetical protein
MSQSGRMDVEAGEYRQPVRSQLGLVKTDGSRFTNIPLADSRTGATRWGAPAGGGAVLGDRAGRAARPRRRGVVAADQRALCLAGFRFELSGS